MDISTLHSHSGVDNLVLNSIPVMLQYKIQETAGKDTAIQKAKCLNSGPKPEAK